MSRYIGNRSLELPLNLGELGDRECLALVEVDSDPTWHRSQVTLKQLKVFSRKISDLIDVTDLIDDPKVRRRLEGEIEDMLEAEMPRAREWEPDLDGPDAA